MLPGISGFEVCKRAREQYPGLGIIMLTAKGTQCYLIFLTPLLHWPPPPLQNHVALDLLQ